jgi:hypothetical protein
LGASPCEVRVLDTSGRPVICTRFTVTQTSLVLGGANSTGVNNARHENLNRRVRLIINRAYGFHSANAALALIMVTLGPIKHVLANVSWFQMSESTHIHAGMPTNEFPPFVRVVGAPPSSVNLMRTWCTSCARSSPSSVTRPIFGPPYRGRC